MVTHPIFGPAQQRPVAIPALPHSLSYELGIASMD